MVDFVRLNRLFREEFKVQCFHCKGKKGQTINKKNEAWASCPTCGASLDRMNRVK